MNAAAYARKSNSQADVADEARSVHRQIDGARAFIAARGWTLDEAHVYQDDGVSGALFVNRAEFQRMMRDAAAGAFEAVVFYDLDRFGRHAHQTMVALNALADLGVGVWDFSTGQKIDLDSFETRLPTILKAEFAQQYREDIRKKTRAAMRYKAEQGWVTGSRCSAIAMSASARGRSSAASTRPRPPSCATFTSGSLRARGRARSR
jgi:site-specific DNA recombinase